MPVNESLKRRTNDSLVPFVPKKSRNNNEISLSANQSIIESVCNQLITN
jgi:hypothetical protein